MIPPMSFWPAFIITQPWIAVLPALALFALWWWKRSRLVLWAGVLWLLYGIYEYLFYSGVFCPAGCNIRVDLLVIHPLLILLSLAGLIDAVRRNRTP